MIELSLLGTPQLRRAGASAEAVLVQPRRLALLAYLASTAGAYQRRDRLLLLFWGDQPESKARASLRQALYFIRQSLGDDVLVVRGDDEVGLNPAASRVDVREFERAVAEGRHEAALALYQGDFLADFNVDHAPDFERWATDRRGELRRLAALAAWHLADGALASSASELALSWTRRALELADHAPGDVRHAMRTMAATGDVSAALALYESWAARLARDLDVTPDAATSALAAQLRTTGAGAVVGPPAAVPPRVSSGSPLATRRGVSRRAVAWSAGLVGLLIVAAFALTQRRSAGDADPATATRVAVFPFTVRSPGTAGYLREGAATLLGLALDGAARLRIVDPNAVLSSAPAIVDLASGRRLAATLGAGHFVLGEIDVAGPRLNVTATLYDAAGVAQVRATAVGDEGRVFELVDSIARRLAIGALTDSSVRLANAAATSTPSLAAFKAFLVGEAGLRAGHYRTAVAALQDAVTADSAFGLAWYRLSLAREWTDGEISSDSAAALAEHFSSRLPDRDRKLLAARRAFVRRDGREGERLAREVLANYPTDADAWTQLGEMRFHLGPNLGRGIEEAREPFLEVLRLRPHDLLARVHLTRIAAWTDDTAHLGDWSTPDATLGDASEIGAFELTAMRAAVLGDTRARDTVAAATMRATDRTVQSAMWRIALYARHPDVAARIAALRRGGGPPSSRSEALVELARGRLALLAAGAGGMERNAASEAAVMLAMPSAPSLPALARRSHDVLARARLAHIGPVATTALVSARILEARYPDSRARLGASAPLPADDARATLAITDAMHALATDPARVLGLLDPAKLDDAVLYRDGLYDIVASLRAEALHAQHDDTGAIAWLRSVGMNSQGSSASIALATRRIAELEDGAGHQRDAARDWHRFAAMWQASDVELHALTEQADRAAR